MRSSHLSTISNFGKFFPKQQKNSLAQQSVHSIQLKQNFMHERPFTTCKFDIQGNKLYLQDSVGTLISLNLSDNNISTLKQQKIIDFAIDGQNNFTILLVNKNSELCKVNFQNKKSQKIMNLNMSKILAFQRNYLREMMLILDYKLLFLCDLTNPSKIKSLKASANQTFTNACFGSNNRFLILAVKNIQIRVLEILNLKTIHKIRLPFQVQNLKIEVSYDNKKIAIYGNCHIIFFISLNENLQPSYQLVELPNIKSIIQLKYTYEHEIVLLANDQVIYAISPDDTSKLVPIFNQQDHIRLMGFDLSIDTKFMAIVSNRTVFTVHWKNGLRNFITGVKTFKQIQFVKNASEKQSKKKQSSEQNKQYQYQEQDDSSDEHKNGSNILNNLNTAKIQDSIEESYLQEIQQLNQSKKGKAHLQQIYTNLLQGNQYSGQLINQNRPEVLQLMRQTYELNSEDPYKTLAICDKLMKNINQETQNAEKFSLILIPQVQSVIEKRFKINFREWFIKNMCKLFVDYLQHQEWTKLVNWILYNQTKTAYISLFFVVLLQQLYKTVEMSQDQDWQILLGTKGYKLELDIRILFERAQKMYSSQQYEYIFARGLKQKPETSSNIKQNDNNIITFGKNQKKQSLQELLAKQQQIKRALTALHGPK